MTVTLLDDFNRANEGPPPSANWTTDYYGAPGALKVASNKCVVAGGDPVSNDGSARWNTAFGPDQEVSVVNVNAFDAADAFNGVDLLMRLQNPGVRYTECDVYFRAGGITLWNTIDGVGSSLGFSPVVAAAGDKLTARAVGSTITALINDVPVLSANTAVTNGGQIALYLSSGSIAVPASPAVEVVNFSGGTLDPLRVRHGRIRSRRTSW